MSQAKVSTERHGHCLCGAIKLSASIERPAMAACHCTRCRRWGGGPALGIETHQAPRLEGEQHLRVYDSSEWAERAFCGQCGSHVFYRLKDGTLYSLSAGLFDDSGDWPFELQIFVDEKPANYSFADRTRTMTGPEVFAQYPQS